jgi:Zn-dependent protease with chaperone function
MPVREIFEELRSKGHIKKSKKCRTSGIVPNFKAGVLFRRTIFYNKEYEGLEDNLLRFALLHEEGHHQGKQYSHLVIAVDLLVIISSIVLATYYADSELRTINAIIYGLTPIYVWLLFASSRIFGGAIQKDELKSDLFAAEVLKDGYAISKPSAIVDRLFKALTPAERHDSIGYRLLRLFFGGMHPEDEDRVGIIAKKVDQHQY